MADINVERKGPSIWPWIIGLLVLALLIWAIAEMVDTDEPEVAEVTEVEQPVAAVPTPEPEPGVAEAPPVSNLMPFDAEDEGALVAVSGQVVAEPIDAGYWVLTDQNDVLFVRTHREVAEGQNVSLTGTLREAKHDDAQKWMRDAQLEETEDWTIHTGMYVQEDEGELAPGMQPGTAPEPREEAAPDEETRPGDTVQGRY